LLPTNTIKTAAYAAVAPNISARLALVNIATQIPKAAVNIVMTVSFRTNFVGRLVASSPTLHISHTAPMRNPIATKKVPIVVNLRTPFSDASVKNFGESLLDALI
jgi:hypothetical protein